MSLKTLMTTLPQRGKLEWIGLRLARRGAVMSAQEVKVIAGFGLEGDHRTARKDAQPKSKRHVTLLQAEHLPVIASLCARPSVEAASLRRNLLVSGVNLLALKDQRFYVGEVLLEGSGPCHPCSRMEQTLGPGGYQAMRGHGGITARVITGGTIRVGDIVRLDDQILDDQGLDDQIRPAEPDGNLT